MQFVYTLEQMGETSTVMGKQQLCKGGGLGETTKSSRYGRRSICAAFREEPPGVVQDCIGLGAVR